MILIYPFIHNIYSLSLSHYSHCVIAFIVLFVILLCIGLVASYFVLSEDFRDFIFNEIARILVGTGLSFILVWIVNTVYVYPPPYIPPSYEI